MMIHDSTFIDPSAQIAENVHIGPFCHIGKNVIIEEGCRIASHVIMNDNVTCKSNVKIFSYVHLGNNLANIIIGENTHIREFTMIGTNDNSDKTVRIAKDNFIMAYVELSNGVELDESCILTNSVTMLEDVTCKEKVIVGGLSIIEANITIGTGVMIGGASYIDKDMPPFTLVEGNKAQVKGLNVVGMRRRFENRDDIKAVKQAYKSIYRNEINKEEALQYSKNTQSSYAKQFCEFIATLT
ncbi:MAG: acyl-ACP--UDP-N- acetylglucosamine O-acyltransferase [Campylobacterota bacterium]|nr:acyl-ACP--UDP-N- acetylglucosamine O-acyltransferase [Campylobacterota bacterium]